jgi:hypothetical protein
MNVEETIVKTRADRAEFRQASICRARQIKRPKEVSLGEHTSLGPKATAPITVICLSPDLTLGVSSRTYSAIDTRRASIKLTLNASSPFVNRPMGGGAVARMAANHRSDGQLALFRPIVVQRKREV